jgi:hypothetical protein
VAKIPRAISDRSLAARAVYSLARAARIAASSGAA